MKKTYITPQSKVISLQPATLIATTVVGMGNPIKEGETVEGDARRRGAGLSSDDDEELYIESTSGRSSLF